MLWLPQSGMGVGVGKVGGKNGDGWSMDAEMDSLGTFEW